MNIACFIINRAMIRPCLKKTPYELWKWRKPNVNFFHAFGYKCFIHNNGEDNLDNFDSKSDEAIFLGYSTTSKVFWVFNKHTLVVEESVHVAFDESNDFSLKNIVRSGVQGLNKAWKTWRLLKEMRSLKKEFLRKSFN